MLTREPGTTSYGATSINERLEMDLGPAAQKLVELYGLPGIVILVLMYAVRVLFVKYTAVIEARAEDGAKIAVAMERNTQAIETLTDWIKDRK
jgi:hypothetical protein